VHEQLGGDVEVAGVVGFGLVHRHEVRREDGRRAREHELAQAGDAGRWPLGEDGGAHVGLGHARGALSDGEMLDGVVRRPTAERV
jgi:hypothetical protein